MSRQRCSQRSSGLYLPGYGINEQQVPIPEDKGCISSGIALPKVSPVFERLAVSASFPGDLTRFFADKIGLQCYWSNVPGHALIKHGIFVGKKANRSGRRSLLFRPGKHVVSVLYPLLDSMRPLLSGAKIAFDIPLDDIEHGTQAEATLLEVAAVILPKGQLSSLRPTGKPKEKMGDGATGGNVGANIRKVQDNGRGRYVEVGPASWSANLSLKQFDGPPWYLRIVLTLPKSILTQYAIKELPRDHRHVNSASRNVQLGDFFTFARFDRKRFENACVSLWETNPKEVQAEYKSLIRTASKNTSVIADVFSAHRVAKALGSTELEERVQKGEFLRPVEVFGAFDD